MYLTDILSPRNLEHPSATSPLTLACPSGLPGHPGLPAQASLAVAPRTPTHHSSVPSSPTARACMHMPTQPPASRSCLDRSWSLRTNLYPHSMTCSTRKLGMITTPYYPPPGPPCTGSPGPRGGTQRRASTRPVRRLRRWPPPAVRGGAAGSRGRAPRQCPGQS